MAASTDPLTVAEKVHMNKMLVITVICKQIKCMHKGIPRNYNLQNLPKETVMHKQIYDK